jgi:hypothetical protein
MNKRFAESFKNPSSEYRGAPFWAWNGTLEEEELRRQIRQMHTMGLGGFFMHSRVGLGTPYLTEEWFDKIKACIDEAEKLGMRAWLYDEDRWPSGAAGGIVTANREYRMRALRMDDITRSVKSKSSKSSAKTSSRRDDEKPLALFTVRLKKGELVEYTRVKGTAIPNELPRGNKLLAFTIEVDEDNSWFNDQAYLDTLNKEAVREFVRVTHEAYKREVGDRFGKTVPGIFTDEPNYSRWSGDQAPWTGTLPEVFEERYGYDLMDRLPELFFQLADEPVSQARYHYYDCITELFVDAFGREIFDWCEANGFEYTGHLLLEDSLSAQTSRVGSCMRFYEYMQAPGMDLLTEHWRVYDTAKQVSSAARQFGRKWRLTETYGCTGWDFPFLGHKNLGDWQAVLGINLRCQHLSWYTMEGQAKRDYPAGIFYQSPWWESYSKVEDYFARVNVAMTEGQEVRDLLVVHPVESMWTRRPVNQQTHGRGQDSEEYIREMNRELATLRDSLLFEHIDFDYGDEDILARHGSAAKSKGTAVLKVAKADYRAAVVPPMVTIRSTTLRLLEKFAKAGGTVVFVGEPPKYVDALPSEAAVELAAGCARVSTIGPKVPAAVEASCRRVSVTDTKGKEIPSALYQLREDSKAFYLMVTNSGHKPKELIPEWLDDTMVRDRTTAFPEVTVRLDEATDERPIELGADSGEFVSTAARKSKSGWSVTTSLPPSGSRLFMFPKRKLAKAGKNGIKVGKQTPMKEGSVKKLTGRWDYTLTEGNVLVLDKPRFRIGNGKWKSEPDVLKADHAIRDAMKIRRRGGRMVQPWARPKNTNPKRVDLGLEYTFEIESLPSGELFLAIERPDTFAVCVNGNPISMDAECGWWCDRSLRRLPLPPEFLKRGENLISMRCDYTEEHPGLEIVYLVGGFGVEIEDGGLVMTDLPKKLKAGDWVTQRLPFYSGSVGYRTVVDGGLPEKSRMMVRVPEYRGVAVRVLVNGEVAGITAWEPNEVDITDLLQEGPNDVVIEVLGHRRNSHGPLHCTEKWPSWTGPDQFDTEGEEWTDDYQLVPCGLMKPPVLAEMEPEK